MFFKKEDEYNDGYISPIALRKEFKCRNQLGIKLKIIFPITSLTVNKESLIVSGSD